LGTPDGDSARVGRRWVRERTAVGVADCEVGFESGSESGGGVPTVTPTAIALQRQVNANNGGAIGVLLQEAPDIALVAPKRHVAHVHAHAPFTRTAIALALPARGAISVGVAVIGAARSFRMSSFPAPAPTPASAPASPLPRHPAGLNAPSALPESDHPLIGIFTSFSFPNCSRDPSRWSRLFWVIHNIPARIWFPS
jgi:hypothetical protein